MGACVSSNTNSTSPVKIHKSSSELNRKTDNVMVIPPSPVKEKHPIVVNNGNVPVKPQFPSLHSSANSTDFGSKEETFFDTQAWLDSDCESDFTSVNGEFTPSRVSTPVHHDFLTRTQQTKGGAPTDDHKPSMTPPTTPLKKKKRLSELFNESFREDYNLDDESEENEDHAKQAIKKGAAESRDATAVRGGGLKAKRERWVEIVQVNGCLPRALSSCRAVTQQQTQVRRK
ncbi:uncharacterized protein At3g27210-like [Rutidosis leptorrhynchoides]|uniref:uncharacterized protein At3g27210-like n=1 Tax=Rutidosis leptorrhynchoides TaxID=125765 RepID=UPI003A9A13BA